MLFFVKLAMEENNSDNSPRVVFRIIIFLAVAGGLIWYLSTNTNSKKVSEKVLGEKEDGIVSSEAFSLFDVLGEKIEAAIPNSVKTIIEEKIVKQTQVTVEESAIVNEIKKTIEQATEEISGFPEKQKKDVKRQIIQQVCEDLLKSVEEEE